ncbi:MAG: FkbM family methyltransferase, partial [Prosthecobacter sp.]|nr:FkbM family methyltransferase [Prosthecobacter sp.]
SGLVVPVADKNEMATFREIFIQQEYDDFLDRLPTAPQTVLDLGCNSGYFAVQILNRARVQQPTKPLPKLVLVDANAQAVSRAQAVVSGSGAEAADLTCITGLVGTRGTGSSTFYLANASAESSAQHRTKHARAVQVPVVDLAKLMHAHFPLGPDLVKCDIEGGEELLVRDWGPELSRARALLVEWHGFEGTWEAFCASTVALGFRLVMERPAGKYKNALFLRNEC